MPSQKLTDAFIRTAKVRPTKKGKIEATEYADTVEKGLCLRVTPAGAKSWTFRYRTEAGKQKRLNIGKLENVSLASARKLVVQHRAYAAAGGDPALEAIQSRENAKQKVDHETLSQVGDWYFKECARGSHKQKGKPKKDSTLRNERYVFDSKIAKQFGKQSMGDISRSQVEAFINDIADSSPSLADKCRAVMHGLFSFAMRKDIVESNPCQFVSVSAQESRDRVLSNSELKKLWTVLERPIDIPGATISPPVAIALQLAMVTLQRRAEVAGLNLHEIDREKRIWTIPSERTKNRRIHVVPLSDLALQLIDEAISYSGDESLYIFRSPRIANQSINPNAITRAFGRIRKTLSFEDMIPHDLRRTGATNLTGEALGFSRFTVSNVLNHSSDTGGAAAATSIYDRNEYLPEKRRALDAWAARLQEIASGESEPTNIVAFNTAKN